MIGFSSRKRVPTSSSRSATGSTKSLYAWSTISLWSAGIWHHLVDGSYGIVVGVDDRLLVDDIELALELVFLAQRNQDRPGIRAELGPHLVDRVVEIRADSVHLVDERDAGNAVLVRLAPDGFGLRLNAGDTAKTSDCAVEHAQGTLHFGREIDVAGSVDDVHPLLAGSRTV